MALPNPPTTADGSRLFAVVYDNGAGGVAAAGSKSVKETTVNGEVLGHMAVGTHKDTDTYASGAPVALIAGINGTDIVPVAVNSDGEVGIHDGGNAISVDDNGGSLTIDGNVGITGTAAVNQSQINGVAVSTGNGAVGTGVQRVAIASDNTAFSVNAAVTSIAAGANTIGGVLDAGWDTAGKTVQRGLQQQLAGDTAEKTLLSADASNLYNITDVTWQVYAGSTAPAAMRRLIFRLGVAGTVFHTVYIPPTANAIVEGTLQFKTPVRSSVNQAITVQLDGAGGTSYEYSVIVQGYKTSS